MLPILCFLSLCIPTRGLWGCTDLEKTANSCFIKHKKASVCTYLTQRYGINPIFNGFR